jgi:DNA-binding IclR family transcriptional regulator
MAREPRAQASAPEAPAKAEPKTSSKISTVIGLLKREQGATLDEMVQTTGWLPHTTRAALTGLKKKGYTIEKAKREDVTCYRIAAEA